MKNHEPFERVKSRFQIALGSCGNTVSFQPATKRWLILVRSLILSFAIRFKTFVHHKLGLNTKVHIAFFSLILKY